MPMHLTHCAQAIAGESMYLCGGFLGTAPGRSVRECFAYGITTNTWRKLPNLPRVVGGGGLVYVGQKHSLLYASGMDRVAGKFGGRDVADSYMLELGKMYKGWIKKAPLGNARNHMAAMSARGRYFFIGGQHKEDESRGNQRTVEEYDVWKNKWITKAGMPEGLGHIAASTVRYWNGIFVVGGIMNGRKLSGRILYYDPLANKWSVVGKFPRSVQSPICGVYGMRLWCTTGQGTPGTAVYGYSRKLSKPLPV